MSYTSNPMRLALLRFLRAGRAFMDPEGNPPAPTGEFEDLQRAILHAEHFLKEEEVSLLTEIAERIISNANPEEDARLGVAYSICRYLGLGWPSAQEEVLVQDEDLLERLYWEFVAARKKAPENERINFKGFLRSYHATINRKVFPNAHTPPEDASG